MKPPIQIPYHEGFLEFSLPEDWSVDIAEPVPWGAAPDLNSQLAQSLSSPLGSESLESLCLDARTAAIVITDATRPCPDAELLPALLKIMHDAGLASSSITVVIALGMHRKSTPEELHLKLGSIPEDIRVVESQGAETDQFVSLGTLTEHVPAPVPMEIHRSVAEADLVVATGIVEPHQYAGFSGGRKTVAIGCASKNTIGVLHGTAFLDHPGTRLGVLDNNPVHYALEQIASRINLSFVVNVVRSTGGGDIAKVAAGRPDQVLLSLAASSEPHTWTPVGDRAFDVVIMGVGAPKDANFYQASRALTYLAFSPSPPLRDGGWVILAASCGEGVGEGPGEQEFADKMCSAASPQEVRERLRREGFGAGGQRAYMVAGALEKYRLVVVGAKDSKRLEAMGIQTAETPDEALRLVSKKVSRARSLVVTHALSTLPITS